MDNQDFDHCIDALLIEAKQESLPPDRDAKLLELCRSFLEKHHSLTRFFANSPEGRVVNIYFCKQPPC